MSVYAFGGNSTGALSLGDLQDHKQPKKVSFFSTINKRVKKIAAGSYNTVFLTDDDELYISGLDRDPKFGTTLFVGIEEEKAEAQRLEEEKQKKLLQDKHNLEQQLRVQAPKSGEVSPSINSVSSSPSSVKDLKILVSGVHSGSQTPSPITTPEGQSPKIPHNLSTRNLLNKEKPVLPTRSELQLSQIEKEKSPPLLGMKMGPDDSAFDISKSRYQIMQQQEMPKALPVRIPTNFLDKSSPGNLVKQVALGNYHIVLLTEGGYVWSWGCNFNGQCGYQQESANTPRMVELKCVKYIAAGVKHTAAINEWGELYVWGLNEHGELGLGDTKDRRQPTRVNKLKSEMVSIVACSSTTSVCYTESGKMYVWGQYEETGKNQMLPKAVPMDFLNGEYENSVQAGGGKIRQIACGQWQVAALTQMGEVFYWKVGEKPTPLRGLLDNNSIRSIAMGNFHLVCLTDSGEVITLGRNLSGQLGRQADGVNVSPGSVKELSFCSEGLSKEEFVVSIAAGEYHSVALVENTPKTKHALNLLRIQRNYLRQLNILEKVYYRSLLGITVRLDELSDTAEDTTKRSGDRSNRNSLNIGSPMGSPPPKDSGSDKFTPISASGSVSSPVLVNGNATIKSRTSSIATIRGIFGIPNAIGNLQDALNESVVTDEEVKEIFSDIESLVRSTETVLHRLDNRIDNWDPEKKLMGDIFLDESILSSYRVYIPFSDNYNTACMSVFNIKKRSEKFVNVLKDCEKRSRSFGIKLDQEFVKEIDLKSLLLAPLQNIPRIYIMLKELSLTTLPNHKDFEYINAAAGKFQVLLERMNQNFQFVDAVEILNCSSNEYGNPQIMGGSLDQLVDKLTHHNISDPNFREVFLLTFRSFTKPDHLLTLLSEIYNRHLKSGKVSHNRVINLITSWVVQHFYDFESDPLLQLQDPSHDPKALSSQLEAFINSADPNAKKTDIPITQMTPISQIWTQYMKQRDPNAGWRSWAATQTLPTPGQVPANFNLVDYTPLEVAQTMTFLDHIYLSRIDKRELLQLRWTKGKAPNVQASTDHFNRISGIVVTEILKAKNSKGRANVIIFFINVASVCFELNNLCGVAAIIYGLNNASISRLKKTWSKLTKDQYQSFEYYDKVVTPMKNYISLRQLMTTIQPPCVPFLGTYLKDLTFIEEGNPSVIGGLINFYKQRKIAEVVFQIQQFQQVVYNNLHGNALVRDFLLTTQFFDDKQAQKASTDNE